MTTFRTYSVDLMPAWLQEGSARALLESFGNTKDGLLARAKDAVKATFPDLAPSDALALIGVNRQLPRGPDEAEESYRARLKAAFDAWAWAGTEKGLLEYGLAPMGFANLATFCNGDFTPPDGDTAFWSRFWLVIGLPHGWTADFWGDPGDWGYDGNWGSDASVFEIEAIQRIVRAWKPAHATCAGILVVFGDTDAVVSGDASPWTPVSNEWGDGHVIIWSGTGT